MDGHPGSAGPPARTGGDRRSRRLARLRGGRWPWLVVGVVLVAGKTEGYTYLAHHRATLFVLAALTLAASLLRPRPAVIAVAVAVLAALVIDVHPFGLGLVFGAGAFIVLLVLFVAIGTALHAWHDHRHPGRLRR